MKSTTLQVIVWVIILSVGLTVYQVRQGRQLNLPRPHGVGLRDYAGALPDEAHEKLEQRLADYNQRGQGKIQLTILEELPAGLSGEAYAASQLLESRFEFNDKVVLLVVLSEEKIFMQAGHNASAALTEPEARAICEEVIRPYFQRRQYVAGLHAGLAATEGELRAGITPQRAVFGGWLRTGLLYILCLQLAMVLLTIMHEASHAIVGLLAGMRIARVTVGSGRTLWQTKIGHTKLSLHRNLDGGSMAPIIPLEYNSRSGMWWMTFAGPGSHLLLGLCLLGIRFYEPWHALLFASTWYPLTALMNSTYYLNWFAFVVNLLPYKVQTTRGQAHTDGYHIWHIPFYTTKEWEKDLSRYFANEAVFVGNEGDLPAAQKLCEQGLTRFPTNEALLTIEAALQLDRGEYERGRAGFAALLSSQRAIDDEYFCWLVYNQVAYADALWHHPEFLAEAQLYSEQSLKKYPRVATFMLTRGAVLLSLNRVNEGLELLQKAFRLASEPKDIAERAAWLALGYVYANDLPQAERWLTQARQPQIPLSFLAEVEREITARRAATNKPTSNLPAPFALPERITA